jgi:hypothetical protein
MSANKNACLFKTEEREIECSLSKSGRYIALSLLLTGIVDDNNIPKGGTDRRGSLAWE